ncbi:cyclic nucleotide-binding domain-containing protein [Chondrinema litorale]|uniref:cyclic nucleotide-binding domain-containing protein n=1 Tax=Chondrinema litorale TaxID=2994555 RepID=UPI0025429E57|nr:cyclic nucleotide-binding domain-containing protein [Chondrinema litorale]UZR94350.1 cyclic nucleotide-binding domain-containing protein [Chondrinema litorale]
MLNPLKKTYSASDKQLFRFLQKNLLFERLEDNELAEFVPFLHLRSYKKNEAIFFRKDPSQAIYIIKSGEVALNLDIEDKFEELTRIGVAQSFGDNALLESTYRIYNAVCTTETSEIYVLATTNVLEIFENNVNIKAKMMTAMAENYEKQNVNLFRAYQESFGFFDLGRAFMKL